MTDEIELKPCPFCGGKAIISSSTQDNRFFARCTRCAASIGVILYNGWRPTFNGREDAADAWNNRIESKGE